MLCVVIRFGTGVASVVEDILKSERMDICYEVEAVSTNSTTRDAETPFIGEQ